MKKDTVVKDDLYKIRHSLAHILAQAIQQIQPDAKLGFGPPIDDGLYYDFILSTPLTEADFKDIEKRMQKIIKTNQVFEEENLPVEEAYARIEAMDAPFKLEYAKELVAKGDLKDLRFFTNGPFVDMCEGPHVEKTREIPHNCFKIRSIAGAYWRGNSDNAMMTRVYVWAFLNKEDLRAHILAHEEALRRDHKKLGKELNLFTIEDEIGKGLPLWLPNGTIIRDELEKYMAELEFKAGYRRVATPHLAKTSLYYTTGHLPYYREGMFPFMELKETHKDGTEHNESYVLKPMNCPHHHLIYKAEKHSYRDLPLRLAEYGHVYRYEDSGSLSGLLRVRGMCMNDAHIYCTEEQIRDEFLAVMDMHRELYATMGITDYYMRFSTWDPEDPKGKDKYVDNPEAWESSQIKVKEAMDASGLPYHTVKGEAAFYGPKIDFQFKTVTGREETASTNQLDFAVPGRMGLTYTAPDNTEQTPYCIHRAPAGTHERFVAFLIEHFGGAFPTWLAPVQLHIITVNDQFDDYANGIVNELRGHMVRAQLDTTSESMGKKIRSSAKSKFPNVLVIGEKEVEEQSVTLRRYGVEEQKTIPRDEFVAYLLTQIRERKLEER